MFRVMLFCGCLVFAASAVAAQEAPSGSLKQDFKTAGKDIGHAGRKVGHGFKRGGREVGHGFKRGAKDVGHGFKHAVDKD